MEGVKKFCSHPLPREAGGGVGWGCSEPVAPEEAIRPHMTWKGVQRGTVGQMPGTGVLSLVQEAAVLGTYTMAWRVTEREKSYLRHH